MSPTNFAIILTVLLTGLAPADADPIQAQEPIPKAVEEVAPPADVHEARRPTVVKRTLKSFLSDGDGSGGGGFRIGPLVPEVEIMSSGSGPGPTLHFWTPDIAGSAIDFHASAGYSIRKYQYYDMHVGLVPHEVDGLPRFESGTNKLFPLSDIEKTASAPGFNIYLSARYRDYPTEDYFGIGSASLFSGKTGYRLRDELYEGVVRLRISRLSLMGRAGVLRPSIRPGIESDVPDTQLLHDERTAPGLFHTPDFLHYSMGAWLEMRDEPKDPRRGVSIGVAVSRFDDRKDDAYNWSRLSLDARQYLPLFSKRHVVALRQVVSVDDVDEGSTVPFYMQPTLGGSQTLRGFSSSRFRDANILALLAEYRFEVHPKIELALIYEAGNVFPGNRGLEANHLLRSYGVGIRLKSPRKVRVRLDVMRSVEGTRVHLKLGPSF